MENRRFRGALCLIRSSFGASRRSAAAAIPLLLIAFCVELLANADTNASAGSETELRLDPVVRNIEGWTVHIEPALLDGEQRDEGAKALAMLANHLQRIKVLLHPEPLAKLQRIEIWIEHDHPRLKPMQYHPSKRWLVDHGHDPRLAKKVHITQAGELLSREQMLKHPAVLLHELAHGYHHQVLGFEHSDIIAAYQQAKESGSYERVLLYNGKRVKHYGLSDHKEYFAEGTEAYFYRNDFYPFVRAELKEHDPTLHALLERVWGGEVRSEQ
jgi:hypothetical protein